jgi:MFS superfamily sulfate permease-like transporter
LPDAPLNLATLKIIFPYSATLAVVGLLESMMMASIIDDLLTPQAIRIGNASAKALPTVGL